VSDYPTDEQLEAIRAWNGSDCREWFMLCREAWWAPEWGWRMVDVEDDFGRTVTRYNLSTGGWSGNEDIIAAMQENRAWAWAFTWQQSRRGGHYIFDVPRKSSTEEGQE
jgi:hypothetical protein